jgi:hypothetical protein
MAQTRDLTYLGSPFGEGKGEAYILPKSDTPAYFLEYLKRGQDEAKAQKAALEKQKEEQQKALEDWDVNYWIGHQEYFNPKVKEVYDEGVDLLSRGYNLKDMSQKPVADWVKKQHDIEKQAQLSTTYGTQADKILNMKPEDAQKYTKASLLEAKQFYLDHPKFTEDMAKSISGMPQLQTTLDMPADIKDGKGISEFKNKLNNAYFSALTLEDKIKEILAYREQYKKSTKARLMQIPVKDFDILDPIEREKAIDEFVETQARQITMPYLDEEAIQKVKLEQDKLAETKRANKAKEAKKDRELDIKEKQFKALNTSMGSGYEQFINGLVTGDKSAFAFAQPSSISNGMFTTTIQTKSGDKTLQQTVIARPRYVDGSKVYGGKQGEKYVAFDYYDANNPTKKIEGNVYGKASYVNTIRVQNSDGSIDEEGRRELSGMAQQNFSDFVKQTGLGYETPIQVGGKYYSIDDETDKGNKKPEKVETKIKTSSSGKKVVRTGTYNGKKVVQYSDGTIEYQ